MRRPAVARTLVLASVGRLGYAMLPLLLLFTVRDLTGSFPRAATAMACFGTGALAAPFVARVVDRHGQRVLPLPLLACGCGGALVALTLGGPPFATAAVAGLLAPPLVPSKRAQWRIIAPDDTAGAYALDGVVEEVLWLVGPALAGVVVTLLAPRVGLVAVPVLLLAGALGLEASPWGPPRAVGTGGSPAAPPRHLLPVLVTMALAGAGSALVVTSVAALADLAGRRGLAAAGEVLLGVGAVAGGLAWSRRPGTTTAPVLLIVWATTVLVLAVLGLPSGLAAMALTGAAAAPLWVVAYGAADDRAPQGRRTEAGAWVTTCANFGSTTGTVAAGALAAGAGPRVALLAAAGAGVVAALTARAWARP